MKQKRLSQVYFETASIHAHYKDILKRTGKVTAIEVKNAFQGIATTQKNASCPVR